MCNSDLDYSLAYEKSVIMYNFDLGIVLHIRRVL